MSLDDLLDIFKILKYQNKYSKESLQLIIECEDSSEDLLKKYFSDFDWYKYGTEYDDIDPVNALFETNYNDTLYNLVIIGLLSNESNLLKTWIESNATKITLWLKGFTKFSDITLNVSIEIKIGEPIWEAATPFYNYFNKKLPEIEKEAKICSFFADYPTGEITTSMPDDFINDDYKYISLNIKP